MRSGKKSKIQRKGAHSELSSSNRSEMPDSWGIKTLYPKSRKFTNDKRWIIFFQNVFFFQMSFFSKYLFFFQCLFFPNIFFFRLLNLKNIFFTKCVLFNFFPRCLFFKMCRFFRCFFQNVVFKMYFFQNAFFLRISFLQDIVFFPKYYFSM